MSKNRLKAETSFTVYQDCKLEEQHNVRCKGNSFSDCFQKRHAFRFWHILLVSFVVVAIIVLLSLLSAGVLGRKKTAVTNDASAGEEVTASPTEHKSSECSSKTTEPATTTQPQSTTAKIRSTEATTQLQSTTAKIPSTKGPDVECGVVIVGGGAGGLLVAYMLLTKKIETSVCIFEKENRLGGEIYDHVFSQAQDVSVGLGQLLVLGDNEEESRAFRKLLNFNGIWTWERSLTRVEARGVFKDDFDQLQQDAFRTLNRSDTVKEMAENVTKADSSLYYTAGAFLSNYLTPEGRELLEHTYGLNLKDRLYEVNPESYKKYLKEKLSDEARSGDDKRPDDGLYKLIQLLEGKVNNLKGRIYFPEKVKSVMKEGSKFFLETTNMTVRANKTVLAVGPTALKDMTGNVMQNIINHKILRSIVSVPAFFGAAVYDTAWWTDGNNPVKMSEKNMFLSSSNCLGVTMPYQRTRSGKGVLQTIGSTGSCSKVWGDSLKISKGVVDTEVKKALKYNFKREIPDALSTVYKYWENGFWYLQKAGTNFSLEEIRDWAKRPLPGSDVFLIGKAFYNFGGWLEDTIRSTNETLVEGWQTELKP